MAQILRYWVERGHGEEIVGQSKTKNQQGELQTLVSISDGKVLFSSSPPCSVVDCTLSLRLVPQVESTLLTEPPSSLVPLLESLIFLVIPLQS